MPYFDNDRMRQLSFIVILLILGSVLFFNLKGFLSAFLGALTLYVLMRKWMFRLVNTRKWRPAAAAGLLMFTSFIIIMIPVWAIVNMLSARINFALDHSTEIINALKGFVTNVEHQTGFKLISDQNFGKVTTFLSENIPMLLGATFNTLASVAMMYFLLYFMLINGKKMEKGCYNYIPMSEQNSDRVGREINNMVGSNAIGIPLIALAQGLVGLVGYYLLGVREPLFWFAITSITAMLPVVGAAVAYIPLSIILLAQGPTWKGIVMLIYGLGVIGTVDNVFRMVLQKKLGDTHPLITILGVIAGLNIFGFIGLIFGPLLISLFLLLIKIYSLEFAQKSPGKVPKRE